MLILQYWHNCIVFNCISQPGIYFCVICWVIIAPSFWPGYFLTIYEKCSCLNSLRWNIELNLHLFTTTIWTEDELGRVYGMPSPPAMKTVSARMQVVPHSHYWRASVGGNLCLKMKKRVEGKRGKRCDSDGVADIGRSRSVQMKERRGGAVGFTRRAGFGWRLECAEIESQKVVIQRRLPQRACGGSRKAVFEAAESVIDSFPR